MHPHAKTAHTQLCRDLSIPEGLDELWLELESSNASHYFATLPSAAHTGLLATWAIRLLDSVPFLRTLRITQETQSGPRLSPAEASGGYHCRTYVDVDLDLELYHIRARPDDILPGLITRDGHLPLKHKTKDNVAEGTIDCNGVASDGLLDFTFFMGRALPKHLLQIIAEGGEHERLWAEGDRLIELPEEIWQRLKDWRLDVSAKEDARRWNLA